MLAFDKITVNGSQYKKNSLEALNLILDPIVVIDKDYNVVFANAEAVKQFGENKNLPCYKYIYGLKEPCWKYAGYFCPIKEAQKETDKKLTYIQYAPKDGLYRKYLLREYIHDGLYVECFVPLKEVLEIIKERPSVGKKHDGTYLSKQEFEVLLNDLLAKGKNFYLIAVNIKKLKYINEIYGIPAGDLTIHAVEQALAKLTQRYNFKFAQIAGGYFIIFLDKNLEEIEKFEKELLREFKKLQVYYMGQNIKPRIGITTVQINPKQVKELKLLYKLIFYCIFQKLGPLFGTLREVGGHSGTLKCLSINGFRNCKILKKGGDQFLGNFFNGWLNFPRK